MVELVDVDGKVNLDELANLLALNDLNIIELVDKLCVCVCVCVGLCEGKPR